MHGYRLACVASIPMECSENKVTTVALVSHDCRTRVGQPALLRKTKARGILQRFNLFACGVFNADRLSPCCGPRCCSGLRAVRSRGSARAFAASKLHFLQKLRSAVGKDYLPVPVQRVSFPSQTIQACDDTSEALPSVSHVLAGWD